MHALSNSREELIIFHSLKYMNFHGLKDNIIYGSAALLQRTVLNKSFINSQNYLPSTKFTIYIRNFKLQLIYFNWSMTYNLQLKHGTKSSLYSICLSRLGFQACIFGLVVVEGVYLSSNVLVMLLLCSMRNFCSVGGLETGVSSVM